MSILDKLTGPSDLQYLPEASLSKLADEIRDRIVTVVSDGGGASLQ